MPSQAPPIPTFGWRDLRPAAVAAGALLTLALAWAYAPNFLDLARRWRSDPNYTHGFVVIPIAAAILWQRRGTLARLKIAPSFWGWVALAVVLAARGYLYQRNEQWLESATIPMAVAALTLALFGWRILWAASSAIAFLWLMLPLPPSLNTILSGPLQAVATLGSTALLQIMGLPVISEGNVILVGSERLEVARACNGLSMLLAFVTLIWAIFLLAGSFPLWQRAVLLVSTVPIAIISNISRVTATAWSYHLLGVERGEKYLHDVVGLMMMLIALGLAWVELKLMAWLIVEKAEAPRGLYIPPTAARPSVKKPKPGGPLAEADA